MRNVPWWVWASATPMGLGAWAPIVPGKQLGRKPWVAWGVLWIVVTLAGWNAAVANDGGAGAGLLIVLGWVGAVATSLAIRPSYLREASSWFVRAREAAELRLEERREAQRLAAEQPDLALELGIGRAAVREGRARPAPERQRSLPGAQPAGLVDVNNAPIGALLGLPGIDDALAQRIAGPARSSQRLLVGARPRRCAGPRRPRGRAPARPRGLPTPLAGGELGNDPGLVGQWPHDPGL